MDIEDCYVRVSSTEEFRNVEKVCFKNGIGWRSGGTEHQDKIFKDESILIHISEGTYCYVLTYERDVGSKNYKSFDKFISEYDDEKQKEVNKMEIGECDVKITSRTEFSTVRDICLENGIKWYVSSDDEYDLHSGDIKILQVDDDGDLLNICYDEDDEADYISFGAFMSRYGKGYTKQKNTKEIKDCNIKITSIEEFKKVEDVCFANNIYWNGETGKKRMDFFNSTPMMIGISGRCGSDYKKITYSSHVSGMYISFAVFMARYGNTKKTSPKYRVRTEQEFIDKFGSNWRHNVRYTFSRPMDGLLNEPLTDKEVETMFDGNDNGVWKELVGSSGSPWHISKDMIIENSIITTIKSRISSFITTKTTYRIKTKEEAEEEFGAYWRKESRYGFGSHMDYLLGRTLTPEETKEYLDEDEIDDVDGYAIGGCMITKDSSTLKRRLISLLPHKEKIKFKLNDSLYKKNKPNLTQSNTVRQL